jgi:hypothetical protein
MLDAEERQQLRAMLERRRGPVPVRLEDGAVDYAPSAADDDLPDAAVVILEANRDLIPA